MAASLLGFQPSLFGGQSFLPGLSLGNIGGTGSLGSLGNPFSLIMGGGGSHPMGMLTGMLMLSSLLGRQGKQGVDLATLLAADDSDEPIPVTETKVAKAAQPSGKDINPDGDFDVSMRDVVKVWFKAQDYDKGITPMGSGVAGYKNQINTVLDEYAKKVGEDSYDGKLAAIAKRLFSAKSYMFQSPGAFITGIASGSLPCRRHEAVHRNRQGSPGRTGQGSLKANQLFISANLERPHARPLFLWSFRHNKKERGFWKHLSF